VVSFGSDVERRVLAYARIKMTAHGIELAAFQSENSYSWLSAGLGVGTNVTVVADGNQ
jgi:hypothetical protein